VAEIPIPDPVRALRTAIEGTEWQGDLFLVGGAVRDALMGQPTSHDFDLVTRSDAVRLAEFLNQIGFASSPPVLYSQFGTSMVRSGEIAFELVTARTESYRGDSRKPAVCAATYRQDAYRRDFTVNALRADIRSGEVLDDVGGLPDLNEGVLRTPLEPITTFHEDPLRMLRAVRFRHRLGFQYATGLVDALKSCVTRLSIISLERVRDEFNSILAGREPHLAFAELQSFGLLGQPIPEFDTLVGVEQGSFHHLDVWNHTLLVLQNLGKRASLNLRWAALLHDIAKPQTRTVDAEGRVWFFSHETVGEEMSKAILRRLRFSEADVFEISHYVRGHMRIGTAETFSTSAARRLLREFGEKSWELLDLVEADSSALKPGVNKLDLAAVREQLAKTSVATPIGSLVSPLDGNEIIQDLGAIPGPEVGRLKHLLTEAVLNGEIAPGDKAAALEYLRQRR
jgi:poly(A) polymerase